MEREKGVMIKYCCPDFVFGRKVYEILFDLMEKAPYAFNNIKIEAIFGSFGSMIWNGGTIIRDTPDIGLVKETIEYYEYLNIPLYLTLTNPLLIETDVYDRYCNKVLEIANNGLNEVLVSSPVLERYIRENFNGIKINKSIVSTEQDEDYISLLNYYNNIVLPRRKGNDLDFLKTIPNEYKNRIEILCNDPCPLNCPRLYDHYKEYARDTLYENLPNLPQTSCLTLKRAIFPRKFAEKEQISYQKIKDTYEPLGYNKFKLSGRGSWHTVLFSVVPYIVKPEYQLDVCSMITEVCSSL